jgi:hypothetical protein
LLLIILNLEALSFTTIVPLEVIPEAQSDISKGLSINGILISTFSGVPTSS